MMFVVLIMMIELIGVYFVLSDVIDIKIISKDMVCGYWVEGIVVMLGGLFNIFLYLIFL